MTDDPRDESSEGSKKPSHEAARVKDGAAEWTPPKLTTEQMRKGLEGWALCLEILRRAFDRAVERDPELVERLLAERQARQERESEE